MRKRWLLTSTALVWVATLGNGGGVTKTVDAQKDSLHSHRMNRDETPSSDAHEGKHAHGELKIPAGQPVPSVDLIVHEDQMQGWNLEVKVSNFKFAPEKVNQLSNLTEGHVHFYIDGEKITRIYSNWYYLNNLEPGKHEVTVSLNANSHEVLVQNDQPIEDTETIEVPETGNNDLAGIQM